MLSISPDRIGHATHLDPDSKKYLAENPIPIEMCMTSNILLNSVKSYQEHHIKDFLFIKYPCCLSTDDKGVFFSDLSDEYAIAASTFSLTQQQLYELSYQCIDCIFDNDVTKEHLKTLWKAVWNVEKRRRSAAKKLLVKDALEVTATAIKIGFRTKEEENQIV
ncbi:16770_t:CDS:2 [Entrophospora sp. SA101]|nr:16770_t:CDS:2 [Entrophospora sp. SA101]